VVGAGVEVGREEEAAGFAFPTSFVYTTGLRVAPHGDSCTPGRRSEVAELL
jgi:hypothetical protein